jgi:hypothetical protein
VHLVLLSGKHIFKCAPASSNRGHNAARETLGAAKSRSNQMMTVPPSLKVTVPVGIPLEATTVAVNVTGWPELLGLADDVSVTFVVIA